MTTVAVMQPYFVPYAGYFRLFAAADVFVAFDCVQFPRRGWVHRNRFKTATGDYDWLTLPIRKCSRDTRIDELEFSPDARRLLASSMQRFPRLRRVNGVRAPYLDMMEDLGVGNVSDYLCAQLASITTALGISRPIVRSSTLNISPDLRGQERVIAIAEAVGARTYVNSPGGRGLYDFRTFRERGLELRFLSPFPDSESILAHLLSGRAADVAALIRKETVLEEC